MQRLEGPLYRWAPDPRHAVNAWFNDFELSVGNRPCVGRKIKRGWGARDHPEGCAKAGGGEGVDPEVEKKIPLVILDRFLRGPVREDRGSDGEEGRGGVEE